MSIRAFRLNPISFRLGASLLIAACGTAPEQSRSTNEFEAASGKAGATASEGPRASSDAAGLPKIPVDSPSSVAGEGGTAGVDDSQVDAAASGGEANTGDAANAGGATGQDDEPVETGEVAPPVDAESSDDLTFDEADFADVKPVPISETVDLSPDAQCEFVRTNWYDCEDGGKRFVCVEEKKVCIEWNIEATTADPGPTKVAPESATPDDGDTEARDPYTELARPSGPGLADHGGPQLWGGPICVGACALACAAACLPVCRTNPFGDICTSCADVCVEHCAEEC